VNGDHVYTAVHGRRQSDATRCWQRFVGRHSLAARHAPLCQPTADGRIPVLGG